MNTKLSNLWSNLKGLASMMTAIAIFSFLFTLAILSFGLCSLWVTGAGDYDLFKKMFWPIVWNLSGLFFVILAIAMVLESLPFHFKKFSREVLAPIISSLILTGLGFLVASFFKIALPLFFWAVIWFTIAGAMFAKFLLPTKRA